jgi:hypothetical protein
MKSSERQTTLNSQAQFCLRFERHLRELWARRRYPVAQGFGPAWEMALEEVPLEDEEQGTVYRALIDWAKQSKLFTAIPEETLLSRQARARYSRLV